MECLDFLKNKNLIFVDIEATDHPNDRRIIQFSGIKDNLDGTNDTLNLLINPQQELSEHIINLLATDNYLLQQYPVWNEVKDKVLNFVKDSVVITFGNFDVDILKKYFNNYEEYGIMFFDYQEYLMKHYSKKNHPPLAQLHTLLVEKAKNNLQHNALYDAEMLKNIFYKIQNLDESKKEFYIQTICHFMPRQIEPKHKIFSKDDFNKNLWTNENLVNDPILIKGLKLGHYAIKDKFTKKKENVKFLISIWGLYAKSQKKFSFNKKIHVCGIHTYEETLDESKNFLLHFLSEIKNRGVIFIHTNKKDIQDFVDVIYNATQKYVNLNYISLSLFSSKNRNCDTWKLFNEIIKNSEDDIKNKLKGFLI